MAGHVADFYYNNSLRLEISLLPVELSLRCKIKQNIEVNQLRI